MTFRDIPGLNHIIFSMLLPPPVTSPGHRHKKDCVHIAAPAQHRPADPTMTFRYIPGLFASPSPKRQPLGALGASVVKNPGTMTTRYKT